MGKRPERSFLQRGRPHGRQVHRKVLTNQGNANENHEISPYTCQNGVINKPKPSVGGGKGTLRQLVGLQTSEATL